MKLVGDAWRDYASKVIPPNAPEVQRTESRRAFYAGARSLFEGMIGMLDPGLDETESDLKKMDDIKAELDQFLADIKSGRA